MVSTVKEIICTDMDNNCIGLVIDQGKNDIMT